MSCFKEETMATFRKAQIGIGIFAVFSAFLYFWMGYATLTALDEELAATLIGILLLVGGSYILVDVLRG